MEVPPTPKVVLTDGELLKCLVVLYWNAFVATVAKELQDARDLVVQ